MIVFSMYYILQVTYFAFPFRLGLQCPTPSPGRLGINQEALEITLNRSLLGENGFRQNEGRERTENTTRNMEGGKVHMRLT